MTLVSCVILLEEEYIPDFDTYLEESGYGRGYLSVPLLHTSGTKWFGCHTWSDQAFMDTVKAFEGFSHIVMSVVYDGEVTDNWNSTLADNGLSLPPPVGEV